MSDSPQVNQREAFEAWHRSARCYRPESWNAESLTWRDGIGTYKGLDTAFEFAAFQAGYSAATQPQELSEGGDFQPKGSFTESATEERSHSDGYPAWRPIETAPKDGTPVILLVWAYNNPSKGYSTVDATFWMGEWRAIDDECDTVYQPLAWMPKGPAPGTTAPPTSGGELEGQADSQDASLTQELEYIVTVVEGTAKEEPEYGHFPGGDPRKFRPDPETCSPSEIERHRKACEAWNAGDHTVVPGGYGVGSFYRVNPFLTDVIERLKSLPNLVDAYAKQKADTAVAETVKPYVEAIAANWKIPGEPDYCLFCGTVVGYGHLEHCPVPKAQAFLNTYGGEE